MDIIHSPSASGDVGITELTGDVTAGPGGDSQAATLTSTGVAAASYGSATQVGAFTVDAKGRLTAASDVTITPAFASITSKPTTLGGYGITDAVNTSQLGAANGVATLDSGSKLTSSQLPDIAVTEYLGDSANEAAMLALTGEEGDWTTRTDLGTVWIITGSDPSVIGGWTQLSYPTAPVTSVAGKTGAVTLDSSDVGLGNVTNDAQLKIASNLADLNNVTTARDNLGLGTMATQDADAVAITGDLTVTGEVGIGLAAPVNKLGIVGTNAAAATSGSAANGAMRLYGAGSGAVLDSGIGGDAGWLQARLYNNYASQLPLLLNPNGGNVGVGTAAPDSYGKLTVNDTADKSVYIRSTSTNFSGLLLENTNSATKWQIGVEGGTYNTAGKLNIGIDAVGSALMIDASRNVGIGTAAPGTKLSVQTATNGGIAVNDGTVNGIIYGSTTLTNSFAIGTTTNHPLIFGTNNSFPQMTLATSGNLGVGTSTPSRLFTVSGATTDFVGLISNSTASGNGLEINAGNNSGDRILELNDKDGNERMRVPATGDLVMSLQTISNNAYLNLKAGASLDATGELSFERTGSNAGNWYIGGNATGNTYFRNGGYSTKMILTSGGNLGVGTSAPTAKLVVAGGGAAIQGQGFPTTGGGWEFYTNLVNGSWAQSYSRTNSVWLDAHWNALTHRYSTSGTERMRITSGGDVILGGTTMPTVGVGGFAWDNVNQYVRFGKMGAGVQTQAIFISATQTCGSITTNQTTTAYNTSSDYRLKENVVPMSDALQRIGNLKPSRFNFIADDSVVVDGFLAHEVQEVVPEAISGEKDAVRDEEYEITPAVIDDDGGEITAAVMGTRSVPDYQGIDQSKLVPLLVGAVQELTARLEALENT